MKFITVRLAVSKHDRNMCAEFGMVLWSASVHYRPAKASFILGVVV